MNKLLFSYSKKDFRIDTFRSGGKGGQNQNKRDTGVRITHLESGFSAESREHRTQQQNWQSAWDKLRSNKEFIAWLERKGMQIKMEQDGMIKKIEKTVDKWMDEEYLKIEYYKSEG